MKAFEEYAKKAGLTDQFGSIWKYDEYDVAKETYEALWKPRHIATAPKDGTIILAWIGMSWQPCYWQGPECAEKHYYKPGMPIGWRYQGFFIRRHEDMTVWIPMPPQPEKEDHESF